MRVRLVTAMALAVLCCGGLLQAGKRFSAGDQAGREGGRTEANGPAAEVANDA